MGNNKIYNQLNAIDPRLAVYFENFYENKNINLEFVLVDSYDINLGGNHSLPNTFYYGIVPFDCDYVLHDKDGAPQVFKSLSNNVFPVLFSEIKNGVDVAVFQALKINVF